VRLAPFALVALIAALLLGPSLWSDRALLPGAALQGMAPWSGTGAAPQENLIWNPLNWDAIAQFYPWRLFAARWISRGVIPFWDPHQFCGTPFLANSQSALFYPPNWLIYLPLGFSVTRGMALVAWLHLTLAGCFTFLWLRALGARPPAGFVAGLAFMLSGFVITWLELPTLPAVACWLPLLFLAVHRLVERPDPKGALATGSVIGLILLAGHLQIAFYAMLGATLYAAGEIVRRRALDWRIPAAAIGALLIGFCLAAPQLLPALELSRMSHRVGVPTPEGFAAYVAYAVPVGHLITLFLPDFYGHPTRGDYWGLGNYAEYCGYVGVVTLLLAILALFRLRRHPQAPILGLLLLFSALMATGSMLNALFYFYLPGFGQSGSPGRILVLFCFAMASLAGLGLDGVFDPSPQPPPRNGEGESGMSVSDSPLSASGRGARGEGSRLIRQFRTPAALATLALITWLLLFTLARAAAASLVARMPTTFAAAWSRAEPAFLAAMALVVVAVLALYLQPLLRKALPSLGEWAPTFVIPALVFLDLWGFASAYNPTAPVSWIYPETEAIRVLRQRSTPEHGARILPVNQRWSLTRHPRAVLPPNAALALGLDDAQGYDSLFLGRYKGLANAIQAPGDSSPPQNGNMIFLSNINSPLLPLLGARTLISTAPVPGRRPVYAGEGVLLYDNPMALPRARVVYQARTAPTEEAELEELARLGEGGAAAMRGTVVLPGGEADGGRPHPPTPSPNAGRGGVRSDRVLPSPSIGRGVGGEGGSPATYHPLTPNTSEVRARLDRSGWLVVTDSHAPGWRALRVESDGREIPLPLTRGDFMFRAVPLPAGDHLVRFRYELQAVRVGLFLAGLGWMAIAMGVGGTIGRRPRDAAPASPVAG
jgi:hypothetical protein